MLGQCPFMKRSCVCRHHNICDLLAIEDRVGWKATREFHVEMPEGDLRTPDMVCEGKHHTLIIDVTIQYQVGSDTLQRSAAEKVAHYQLIVSDCIYGKHGEGKGHGVSSRWPSCNNKVVTELGIPAGRIIWKVGEPENPFGTKFWSDEETRSFTELISE